MRTFLFVLSLTAFVACQSSADKEEKSTEVATLSLDPNVKAIVHYIADSVATCSTWLNMESEIRMFFNESDTLADFIEEKFSHDEIIESYDQLDGRRILNLTSYLSELKIIAVDSIPSEINCISSINNIILLDNSERAIVIFTELHKNVEVTSTLLLARKGNQWHLAEQF